MRSRKDVALSTDAGARRPVVLPTGPQHRVTTLELFFDLVFVFAFTQVTALVAASGGAQGAVRGLVLAALLWWAWCSYSWLGNQARADEGIVRHAMFLAMGAMMVLALAIPEAWHDEPGGLDGPVVLAACFTVVQWCHLGVYAVAAGSDRGLRRQIALVAAPVLVGNVLLLVGSLGPEHTRTWWWLAALVVNYTGIYVAGASGWRLPAPAHFAERYALIVLIALGESIVAIGVGVAALPVSLPIVVATAAAIALAITLWWLYFDVLALVLEHRLVSTGQGAEQTALARDTFTYLHFPIVAAVLGMAVGIKKVFAYVGDPQAHTLADAVHGLPALLLAGGPAVFLVALSALRRRNTGAWSRPQLAAAVALAVLAGVNEAAGVPALAYLAAVAAVLVALVLLETRWSARTRAHYRYPGEDAEGSAAPDGSAGSDTTAR
jgi:low temperature requirement protein LtrA